MGLSNANGVVAFNGNTATIQTLTAEAGGGKVTLTGFVSNADNLRFSVRTNAAGVRVARPTGRECRGHPNVNLAGTTDASLASGTVTIDRLTTCLRRISVRS
jgi:translocation and assembly module TamB